MNRPKIRFKGYTDDWEQRKLGEIFNFQYGEFNNNPDNGGEYPIYGANGVIGGYTKYNAESSSIIGHMGAYAGYVVWAEGKHFVTYNGTIAKPSDNFLDCKFGYYLLSNKQIYKICAGSGQPFVSYADLNGIDVVVPKEKLEQEQVAKYFTKIDHLITLHQRKCEQTKKLKKFMLQKMFPQNGSSFPEIRFSGFTDAWEQRKFSEIASRESTAQESSRDFPSVEYEDVITEAGQLNKDISQKETVKKGIAFDGSQVLYGKLRPYLHNWLNPDFSGVAVGDWWVLKPIETDKSFLYRLIQTQQFDDIANQSAGSKMPRADWNLVSNSEFAVPVSQDEQAKIGAYFGQLDTLITLHQRKCDELQNIKKFMLQNMFV